MYDIDNISTQQAQSPTALVCENAALFARPPSGTSSTPARSGTEAKPSRQ